jgi:hypothetical protein
MKHLRIFLALLAVGAPVQAQLSGPRCSPYEPQPDEVASVVAASRSVVPASALLREACVVEEVRQLRPGVLEHNDSHFYEFDWPTGERVLNSERWVGAACRRNRHEGTACEVRRHYLRTRSGRVTELDDDITNEEITEVQSFLKERVGEQGPLRYIRRTGARLAPDAWHETLRYRVGAEKLLGAQDMHAYELIRRCAYEMCQWELWNRYTDYPVVY